jgi:hypothetical protein
MSFPAWRYGPKGEAEVFQSEADVPKGWVDHPSKVKAAPIEKFDHNGDGKPGGSTAPEPTEDLAALRAKYKDVVGKRAFPGWDVAEIERRLAEHAAAEIDVTEF